MVQPFVAEELFEINPEYEVHTKNEVLYVDNFYLNYKTIMNCLYSMHIPNWKITESSRNFKDYFDCRPLFANHYSVIKNTKRRYQIIKHLLSKYLKQELLDFDPSFEFNYFKHIKTGVSNNFQHHPHYDEDLINMIVYLDTHANGGTAIYKNMDIKNQEEENLLYDVSELQILDIIEAKPNRCVFFNGNNLHGGFIKDHTTYEKNWRINQINFLNTKEVTWTWE